MCDWIPHQDLILEAIDQLRRRKARPDAERIYNCLFRRKGLGSNDSRIALDRCVESGVVLRVSYKGNISYRNAAKKYARQKRRAALSELSAASKKSVAAVTCGRPDNKPRRKFTNLLTNTFAELVLQNPDYLDLGIPEAHLIKTILSKDNVRYTKRYLWILLQKEVENGGLVRLSNNNFIVGKPQSNSARKQHGAHQEKEQLTKIKKEMRSMMHRKPFDAKSKSSYEDTSNDMKVDESGADENHEDDEEDDRSDDSRGSNEGDGSGSERSDRSVAVAVNTTTATSRAGGRGGARVRAAYQKRGSILGKTGRVASVRERLTMENMLNENSQRVGGRRKKAKKVFDPSESNMPKRRGRPPGSTKNAYKRMMETESRPESRTSQNGHGRTEGGVCSVCHIQNKKGPVEKMISCRECSNKAHSTCLNGDDMMLKMYPDNTWQCPHCKTCVVCYETSDAGNLVVCSICADAYHNSCHSPRITEKLKPNTKWLCNNCKMADQLAVDNIQIGYNVEQKIETNDANAGNDLKSMCSVSSEETPESTVLSPDLSRNSSPHFASSPSSPILPTLSPQMNHNGHNHHSSSESDIKSDTHSIKEEEMDQLDENIDPSIPDASNWSPEEVEQYFAEYFPEEARVFKEQEIDGHSLLLMKRMDVIKGLHLKLGPALKIYRHVLKLQYRRDDQKLYWA